MMLELTADLVRAEGVALDRADLLYGWEHGVIGPEAVIELASDEIGRGCDDDLVMALGCLLADDADRVREILGPPGVESSEELSGGSTDASAARKWLYLEMRALYLARDRAADPLSEVEDLYCDFGHPDSIAGLVRWMPLRPGEQPGEDAIMRRWQSFLESEHDILIVDVIPGASDGGRD
ncbi:MAG: DUF2247 family protein [Propionibacteriaceae bacterium]|nr:DUF2247 family protein [Propionibacteriaceae bacterium]